LTGVKKTILADTLLCQLQNQITLELWQLTFLDRIHRLSGMNTSWTSMKHLLNHRYFFSVVLIVIYMALPATGLATAVALDSGLLNSGQEYSSQTTIPSDNCPCSDEGGSGCCETLFCSCECHAPLDRGLQLIYAPVIACQVVCELPWSLPQVYRTIVVPPQNHA
jgi:hypothetical protein